MDYLLIIDDTSFNKNNKNSNHLKDRIMSMCGYLLPTNMLEVINNDVENELYYLYKDFNADEFHFTEMYNRINKFKNFTTDNVLDYISIFRQIVLDYDLKIITYSLTNTFKEKQKKLIENLDGIAKKLNLTKNLDEAECLLLNIITAKKYIKEQSKSKDKLVGVVCDEGLRKDGAEVALEGLYEEDLPIKFLSSNKFAPLQIADFCAWSKSRVEQTLDKYQDKEMKDFERRVLINLQDMQKNYVNLKLITTNFKKGVNLDSIINIKE